MALQLGRLNQKQKTAVLHGDGPLLVLAGAGSGKTSTMAYRIAHLVAERAVPATAILGLSFTNKAAQELKDRVLRLISESTGRSVRKELTISTFHSLCVKILRAHGERIGFRRDFTILDENDQKDVLKEVFRNIRIDDRRFDLDVILFEIGQAKNRFLTPEQAETQFLESGKLTPDYAVAAAASFTKYQQQLRALNAMDFDDLLYHAVRLLEQHPEVREHYNRRFRYILVDEYQDTNPSQSRLLRCLTESQQNLCVVGDDDQSIYAWRGADPTHILGFQYHYPGASMITLDQNYRSTNTILDAANHVISHNRQRHPKKLWSDRGAGEPLTEILLEDDREEGKFVAEELFRMQTEQKRRWSDFAILYRSNAQSRIFEESMRALRIPYKIVGGYSFLDRKEVKNTLAYWRLVLNADDDASLRRVLNWPSRGVGKTSLETLGTAAFGEGVSVYRVLPRVAGIAPRAEKGAQAFLALISGLRAELERIPPGDDSLVSLALANWARGSLEKAAIRKAVDEESDDPVQAAKKWENVEELVHALGQVKVSELPQPEPGESVAVDEEAKRESVGVAALREFLNRMTLESKDDDDKDDKDKDQVTLLTLHGAKGLEFPVVFLVGMEDGFLPHKRTLEEATDLGEERRLCYVGITRARDTLYFTRAKNRTRFGKTVPRTRSRFMDEVPVEMLVQRDESRTPTSLRADQAQHEERVKNYLADIKSKLLQGGGKSNEKSPFGR